VCGRSVSHLTVTAILRALRCHLRAGFQQCKSFVEMCTVGGRRNGCMGGFAKVDNGFG
jgi:hypothetical protein